MIKLKHPSAQIVAGHIENGRHGVKELDYEIVDDHYLIYLPQRPTKLAVTSDGRLLHNGPVFPGMMRLASPGEQVHVGVYAHTEAVTLAVPGAMLRDTVRALEHRPSAFSHFDIFSQPNSQVAQIGRMISRRERFDTAHEALFLHGITLTLLVYFFRYHGSLRAPYPSAGLTPKEIQLAIDYADANIEQTVTLDSWAAELRMPPNEFRRRFRKTTGCSPYAWYMQRRVDRAKELLKNPSYPLCQIALSVGFSSQSHFTEAFRRREGVPPGRWRWRQ